MYSVCRCILPVKRRRGLRDLLFSALDQTLGESRRETTTHEKDHEYFIPTKFHQNPSDCSGEERHFYDSIKTSRIKLITIVIVWVDYTIPF